MRYLRYILPVLAAAMMLACEPEVTVVVPKEATEATKPGKDGPQAPEGPQTPEEPEAPETPEPESGVPAKLDGIELSGNRWVGLDLKKKHVITRVGYKPQSGKERQSVLALWEGANQPDFSDALPLGIIKETGQSKEMNYQDIACSRGFRFVLYMAPSGIQCDLADFEFYGYAGEGNDSQLCQLTNLPTVVITTRNHQEITSKKEYILSSVYIISDGGKKVLATTDTGIRGRGNASWTFPKKPYRIKFAEKHNVLNSPSCDRSWTLINNYGDKTLMRNILAFEVSRRVGMAYTPFCAPVDVVLNSDYQGCYQLCDQVEMGTGRVEAKDGYLIEIDAYAYDEDVNFYSNRGIPVSVKYPKDDEITTQQRSFIKTYFGKLESAVFSSSYTDKQKGYRKYLDLDSFLRNFIVGEFCGNTDTYWSVNMYKDAGDGVLFTGPVWDYDLAFENDNRTYPINNLSDYIYASKGSVADDDVRTMVTRIVTKDKEAHARLIELWCEAKPKLADLNSYVDETAALLEESQDLNFKRWPILGAKVHQNPKAYGSYQAEVDVVKAYITGRLTTFDNLVRK